MSTTQDAKKENNIIILFSILSILLFVAAELFYETPAKSKKEAYQTKIQELNNRIKQIEIQKQELLEKLNTLENKK